MSERDPYAHYAPPAATYAPPAGAAYPYAGVAPMTGYRTNVLVPPGSQRGVLPSPALRVWKLVVGIVTILTLFAGVILCFVGALFHEDRELQNVLLAAGGLVLFGSYLPLIAWSILSLVSLYKLWAWVPPEQRYTNMWKRYISPGVAVGFMLVPYFNVFWLIVMYLGLCDVVARMRVAHPTSKPEPRTLAIANIVVGLLFFPASPITQYLFDKELEGRFAEIEAQLAAGDAARAHG